MLKRKMVAENRGLGAQLYWLTRNATYFSEQMQLRLKSKKQQSSQKMGHIQLTGGAALLKKEREKSSQSRDQRKKRIAQSTELKGKRKQLRVQSSWDTAQLRGNQHKSQKAKHTYSSAETEPRANYHILQISVREAQLRRIETQLIVSISQLAHRKWSLQLSDNGAYCR